MFSGGGEEVFDLPCAGARIADFPISIVVPLLRCRGCKRYGEFDVAFVKDVDSGDAQAFAFVIKLYVSDGGWTQSAKPNAAAVDGMCDPAAPTAT